MKKTGILFILFLNSFFYSKGQSYPYLREVLVKAEKIYSEEECLDSMLVNFSKGLSRSFDLNFKYDSRGDTSLVDDFIERLNEFAKDIQEKLNVNGIGVDLDIYLSDMFLSNIGDRSGLLSFIDLTQVMPSDLQSYGFEYYRDSLGRLLVKRLIGEFSNKEIRPGSEVVKIDEYLVKYLPNGLLRVLLNQGDSILEFTFRNEGGEVQDVVLNAFVKIRISEPSYEFIPLNRSTYILRLKSLKVGDAAEIRSFLNTKRREIDKLILDIRGFGGGYLSELISIVDLFCKKGEVILSVKYYSSKFLGVHKAKDDRVIRNLDLIVLIDKNTDSGALIIAGSIKYQGLGVLIGEQTDVDRLIRMPYPLPMNNNYIVLFEIGEYVFGSDRELFKNGVPPDIFVKNLTNKEVDAMLDYARTADLDKIR